MKDFKDLTQTEYSSNIKNWESALKAELKIEDAEAKLKKKYEEIGAFPVLSTESKSSASLPSYTNWKKASQTYILFDDAQIKNQLKDDFENGVRVFFFHGENLKSSTWDLIQEALTSFEKFQEIEIFILGGAVRHVSSKLKLYQAPEFLMMADIPQRGGHLVHELAILLTQFIERGEGGLPDVVGVHVDSHFFKNIAKIRALRLLILKVLQELNVSKKVTIAALNSYSDWTLFERYSNILRNSLQVSSSLISGADYIQSSGYQTIFHLEVGELSPEHDENSYRIARNSSHVLALESMLGIVEDAAFGSFHLDTLTQTYAEEAWKLMQVILPLNQAERKKIMYDEVLKVQNDRINALKKRKKIISGINDFPDSKEKLRVKLKKGQWNRPARIFEELRLQVEEIPTKRKVKILIFGQISELNSRISFVRNYFELLGLEVLETTNLNEFTPQDIIILCAKDDDYQSITSTIDPAKAFNAYIAGKVIYPGWSSLYMGQDVYGELDKLVQKFLECP
jgi:Methylmalonyl-CoA mutase